MPKALTREEAQRALDDLQNLKDSPLATRSTQERLLQRAAAFLTEFIGEPADDST